MSDLLGHLASRLSVHPENVATEALAFVLQRSPSAREALRVFLQSHGSSDPGILDYKSQAVTENEGTPDIAGCSADGKERVLVEGKFWAGLTAHQPTSYLRRLGPQGTLVFVVPSVRLDLLWTELQRRLASDGFVTAVLPTIPASRAVSIAAEQKVFLLTSWNAVLVTIAEGARQAGEDATVANVGQLQGLCARMDQLGFRPLAADELTSGAWRRFFQMSSLIPDIVAELRRAGVATEDGRLSHGPAWSGQKLVMDGVRVALYFDAYSCARLYPTPFWLSVPLAARPLLAPIALAEPARVAESEGLPYVGLPIRTGVERADVIADVVASCIALRTLVAPLGQSPGPVAAGSPPVLLVPDGGPSV